MIYRHGVPFTLGHASLTNRDKCYNYVEPFPCIEKQDSEAIANRRLINAIDLVKGYDGVIWVLDIGISETLSDNPCTECDPKVVGYDPTTGKVREWLSNVELCYCTCQQNSNYRFSYKPLAYN